MHVILVENGEQKGKRFELKTSGALSIGRDQKADICLPDPMISRRHVVLEARGDSFVLKDLKSVNGTLVNGIRVEECVLKQGDHITAGQTLLTFLNIDTVDALPGKVLKGYEVIQRIGRGGMGTVYQARQVSLDRLVALKLLAPEMVADPSFVSRFLEEARSAARLNHPNIVMVYDIDDEIVDGQHVVYYTMEYMAGGSVEDFLGQHGPLDPERALVIAQETARGLLYAERVGMVHRDIKPGNLMIHENGTVKIGDLGIAAHSTSEGSAVSQKGGVSGSPHYISPEQARGHDLDSRADIYSLGISLFQMLTGKTPFGGSDVRELIMKHLREPPPDLNTLRSGLPEEIAPLINRMLEKNRDHRFPDVKALLVAIETILGKVRGTDGEGEVVAEPVGFKVPRRILALVAALVILAGLVVGSSLVWDRYRRNLEIHEQAESDYRGQLNSIGGAIQAGDLDLASQELGKLLQHPDLEADFPEIAAALPDLEDRIQKARRILEMESRKQDARNTLAAFLEKMPELSSIRTPREFDELLPPLRILVREYSGTPAATEARKVEDQVRLARDTLERKHKKGNDALRSLLITARTFLTRQPARYREALEELSRPSPDIQGTPSAQELAREVERVSQQMLSDAGRWAEEARAATAQGQTELALRRLGQQRDLVEGKGLEIIERAIEEISGGGDSPSPSPSGDRLPPGDSNQSFRDQSFRR